MQFSRPPRRHLAVSPLLFLTAFSTILLVLFFGRHPHFPATDIPYLHAGYGSTERPERNFSIVIKVLAFDRLPSLRRCLVSLASALYPSGDRVPLHIYLDHLPNVTTGTNLSASHDILQFVDGFHWPHGAKVVNYRTTNAGLQAQWLEAWWPSSDDEFAFVVEDDLEVSPLYFEFLKRVISWYYYDMTNFSPSIFGVTLQRPRFVAGKHGNKLQLDSKTRMFLYQMVGTWGQLLFPVPWKEFRLWYDLRKERGYKPFLHGMVTTGWYKKMGERIWTPWFIKFIHSRGYFNVYTHFLEERALCVSHRDAGVNYGRNVGPDSVLIGMNSLDITTFDLLPLENLKWYDFCFREVVPRRVVGSLGELRVLLTSFDKGKPVVLIGLYSKDEKIAKNLICHLEKVNFMNYIFVSTNSDFLYDLARRGYPVIDANQLIASEMPHSVFVKEILANAAVIKQCLKLGYNLWFTDGNMIPFSRTIPEPPDLNHDIFTSKELLFFRTSDRSVQTWGDTAFISKLSRQSNSMNAGFACVVSDALASKQVSSSWVQNLDLPTIAVDLGGYALNWNSSVGSQSLVFWQQDKVQFSSAQQKLESLDLWLLDGDCSCNAVYCHGQQ